MHLKYFSKTIGKDFFHVSTDELYGSFGESDLIIEKTLYVSNLPYSANKASSDHTLRAYGETYG